MHHSQFSRKDGQDAASEYLTRNYNERKIEDVIRTKRAERFFAHAFGFFCGGGLVLCALHFAGYIP